jgi:Protein of unknown function (DUF1194)
MMRRASQLLCAAALACALSAGGTAQEATTDLALVIAIDCSFSVDSEEFHLQMRGLGQALQDAEVWDAISRGPNKRIVISAFQWSDNNNQTVVLPWTVIDSEAAAQKAGAVLETMPRRLAEGGTSITNALAFAGELLNEAPSTLRQVIDVSTDGRNNIGPPLPPVRDRLVARDVTINALAITNEFPTLHIYAETHVIGGAGAFVMKAKSYDDYGAAMLHKLIREIVGPGVV